MHFTSIFAPLPLKCEKNKRLLLGSGGFATQESKDFFSTQIDLFLGEGIEELLLIPFAQLDTRALLAGVKTREFAKRRKVVNLASVRDPIAAIRKAQAFLVWGGNTFKLLKDLQELKLLGPIRKKVEAGVPYVGVSAGTVVACPTISTTNDMAAVFPKTLDALGLISFQINAHYFPGAFFYETQNSKKMTQDTLRTDPSIQPPIHVTRYLGESRDDRIREYLSLNSRKRVVGIPEGTFLKIENGKVLFCSHAPAQARLFQKNLDPQIFETRADLL